MIEVQVHNSTLLSAGIGRPISVIPHMIQIQRSNLARVGSRGPRITTLPSETNRIVNDQIIRVEGRGGSSGWVTAGYV